LIWPPRRLIVVFPMARDYLGRERSPEAIASRKEFYRVFWLRTGFLFAAFWAELLAAAAIRHGAGALDGRFWNPLGFPGMVYHAGLVPGLNAWIFLVMTAAIFVTTVRWIPRVWCLPTALSFAPVVWWMAK